MPTCYISLNGVLKSKISAYKPCGDSESGGSGIVSCCSSGHTCMSNAFCYYPETNNNNGVGSHYYLSGCTDPELKDPACGLSCSAQNQTDSVWLPNENRWQCCGDSLEHGVICDKPTGEKFDAPGPDELYPLATWISSVYTAMPATYVEAAGSSAASQYSTTVPASGILSTVATAASLVASGAGSSEQGAQATVPAATATVSSDSVNEPPNTAAIAAGVIAGVFGLALIGALVYIFQRKRNGKAVAPLDVSQNTGSAPQAVNNDNWKIPVYSERSVAAQELENARIYSHELPSAKRINELPTH